MKFYVLRHPEKGYLKSKEYQTKWANSIEFAKKWNQKNHPSGVRTQCHFDDVKECSVEEINYQII